jgi:DNA repair exonuclease SbcCD nuclease subunit
VLLVADTHLGFDLPFRPRVKRRRRGHDFFANFNSALQPAINGDVDLVVHGGDLFYRSKVPAALVDMAMAPLVKVAKAGTPVFIVPGNHERSSIPLHLWTAHPNLHIFDRPRTFLWSGPQGSIALSGFPFARGIRDRFSELVGQTGFEEVLEVPRLLCMHQTVEGAQVGANNYTFRSGVDVVRGLDIPADFSAVLSGHIHRAQVLRHDLGQRLLAAPVVYPGSIERTSFAERTEEKGYVVLTVDLSDRTQGTLLDVSFVPLPARPMVSLFVEPMDTDIEVLSAHLAGELRDLDPDSVVRVVLQGHKSVEARRVLSAATLRQLAPPTMNIWLAPERAARGSRDSTRN